MFGPIMYEGFGQTETLIPILVKSPSDYLVSDGSFDEEVVRTAGKAVDVARLAIMDPEGNLVAAGRARRDCRSFVDGNEGILQKA